ATRTIRPIGGSRIALVRRPCFEVPGSRSWRIRKKKSICAAVWSKRGGRWMIEAVMLWNEPNNLSHWNFEIDPEWKAFAAMVNTAADAVQAENSGVKRV